MDPAFIRAVQQAGELLLQEEELKAMLMSLRSEQEELKQLKKEWLG